VSGVPHAGVAGELSEGVAIFARNGVAITREIRSPTRTKSLLQGAALVVAPRRDTMRGLC